jgi:chromosome segregation ATPase
MTATAEIALPAGVQRPVGLSSGRSLAPLVETLPDSPTRTAIAELKALAEQYEAARARWSGLFNDRAEAIARARQEAASAARAGRKLPAEKLDQLDRRVLEAQAQTLALSDAVEQASREVRSLAPDPAVIETLTTERDQAQARALQALGQLESALDALSQAQRCAHWARRPGTPPGASATIARRELLELHRALEGGR